MVTFNAAAAARSLSFFCFLISLLLPYGCDMSLFWTFIQPSSLDIRELRYGRILGRRYQKGHCVSVSLILFSLSLYICVCVYDGCATIKKWKEKIKEDGLSYIYIVLCDGCILTEEESLSCCLGIPSHLVVLLAAN